MKTRLIAWEPHPVTPGRKAELVRAGFQIVDAAFAPPPEHLQTVRAVSGDDSGGGPLAVISNSDFNPELHAVHDPEAEAERLRLQAEAEAAEKAEAERLAALQQPEAAPAAEAPAAAQEAAPAPAPAAASARKRAGSTTTTTEA